MPFFYVHAKLALRHVWYGVRYKLALSVKWISQNLVFIAGFDGGWSGAWGLALAWITFGFRTIWNSSLDSREGGMG